MSDSRNDFAMLLRPNALALVVLDHQEDFLTALSQSIRDRLTKDTVALVRVAKACGVPVILSSISSEAFRGSIVPPLQALFPKTTEVKRECINCWDDQGFIGEIKAVQRDRLLLAGLWTETAITFAALSGLELGYRIYLATDATAGISVASHDTALRRMVQAGVVPVTWPQLLFEWYRISGPEDSPVSQSLIGIAQEHGLVLGKPSSCNF